MTSDPPSQPTSWWEYTDDMRWPASRTANVDDVHLAQPVGFVWFRKPRYRVKAISRKRNEP